MSRGTHAEDLISIKMKIDLQSLHGSHLLLKRVECFYFFFNYYKVGFLFHWLIGGIVKLKEIYTLKMIY